jgi:hypothetical protein
VCRVPCAVCRVLLQVAKASCSGSDAELRQSFFWSLTRSANGSSQRQWSRICSKSRRSPFVVACPWCSISLTCDGRSGARAPPPTHTHTHVGTSCSTTSSISHHQFHIMALACLGCSSFALFALQHLLTTGSQYARCRDRLLLAITKKEVHVTEGDDLIGGLELVDVFSDLDYHAPAGVSVEVGDSSWPTGCSIAGCSIADCSNAGCSVGDAQVWGLRRVATADKRTREVCSTQPLRSVFVPRKRESLSPWTPVPGDGFCVVGRANRVNRGGKL